MKILRPDAKGRIYLGELAKGVALFEVKIVNYEIKLIPLVRKGASHG